MKPKKFMKQKMWPQRDGAALLVPAVAVPPMTAMTDCINNGPEEAKPSGKGEKATILDRLKSAIADPKPELQPPHREKERRVIYE